MERFYIVTESPEEFAGLGAKESSIRKALKTKAEWEHFITPSGCIASDDGPVPDVYVYRIERIA